MGARRHLLRDLSLFKPPSEVHSFAALCPDLTIQSSLKRRCANYYSSSQVWFVWLLLRIIRTWVPVVNPHFQFSFEEIFAVSFTAFFLHRKENFVSEHKMATKIRAKPSSMVAVGRS